MVKSRRIASLLSSLLSRHLWRQVRDFASLPSREEWPEYYATISAPICIDDIFRKTQNYEYASVEDAVQDWELLINNAQKV